MRIEYPVGTLLYESDGLLSLPRVSPDAKSVAFVELAALEASRGDICLIGADRRKRTLYGEALHLQGLCWKGSELWFTAYADRGVTSLHAVTASGRQRLVAKFSSWSQLSDLSSDDGALLITSSNRHVTLCKPAGAGAERDLSWFDSSYASDLTADGRSILLNETLGGGGTGFGIYLRPIDGSASVRLGEGEALRISPDGRWVLALARPRTELLLIPTGAGETRRMPCPSSSILGLSWLPDSRRFVFSGHAPDGVRLYLQSVAGEPAMALENGEDLRFPVASPDGTRLAVITSDDELAVVSLSGGPARPLPGDTQGELPIQWSPDGRQIYAHNPRELPLRIFRIDVASGQRQLWKHPHF